MSQVDIWMNKFDCKFIAMLLESWRFRPQYPYTKVILSYGWASCKFRNYSPQEDGFFFFFYP